MAYNHQFLSFSSFTRFPHYSLLLNFLETSDSMLLHFLPTYQYQPCLGFNSFPVQPRPPRYIISHYNTFTFWSLVLLTPFFFFSTLAPLMLEYCRESQGPPQIPQQNPWPSNSSESLYNPSKLPFPLLSVIVTISNLHNSLPVFNSTTSISYLPSKCVLNSSFKEKIAGFR